MSLKKRLILLLFGALIIFGLLLYALQYLVIVPGYGALEKEAARAANTVILAAIAFGIVIIILLLVYLQRFILKPISNLSRHAVSIRETDDLSLRCSTPRNDEIGVLSREIDHLVERLLEDRSETHRKLKAEINGHRKAEETLKEQQAFLRQLFENSPFGIVVMDAHNNILDINREFESIFQYSLKEIKGKSIDDVVVPGNKTNEAADVTARTFQGETVQIETVRERKDGRPVEVIAYGVPIYLDGTRIGIYAIYMDITELRENQREKNRLKDRLVEAKKMEAVGTLAGGMAHEFNNLMAIILGNVEMVLGSGIEDRVLQKRLEAIKSSAERSATLTNQLLSFSRKQMLQLERLDFNDLISNISFMIHNLFGEGVKQKIISAPNLVEIEGDQSQLTQVILDLVQNACDAMPETGRLTIETRNVLLDEDLCKTIPDSRPGRFVCISVTDTGTGMSPETLKHIFEPFFTTRRMGNATGLGLAFVYGTIMQHNGCLNVSSEVGKGTTFEIYLPTVSEPDAPADGEEG